jgi:hypothetical protein
MSLDLLIMTIPPNWLEDPSAAPAVLKGAVEQHGFKCKTIDFSLVCFEEIFHKNYDQYLEWTHIFPGIFDFGKITKDQMEKIDQSLILCVKMINDLGPKLLGLSIFSEWQHRYAYLLCKKIRELDINVQIVVGGMGCSQHPVGLGDITHLNYFDKQLSWAVFMTKQKLVDHIIINDGEKELVNLLSSSSAYQSNETSNEVDLENYSYPNYDDYFLDKYLYFNDEKKLLIQGSKGCVRQCVFCSEHGNYTKFYFKQGSDIADEMINLSHRYNVYKFQFTDSLVNGPLESFRKFITKLAHYNINNSDKAIKWHGNYICRSNNSMTDDDYILLKQSGAHGLTIGAETGSNNVLDVMKKKSTVEDLLYEISKFREFDIDCYLLFMVGFYSETWNDFLDTLSLLKKLQPYVLSKTISSIRASYTMLISDWKRYNIEDFIIDPNNGLNWIYKNNKTLDLKERCRRRVILQEFCDELGIPVSYANADLLMLDNLYNNKIDMTTIDSKSAHN